MSRRHPLSVVKGWRSYPPSLTYRADSLSLHLEITSAELRALAEDMAQAEAIQALAIAEDWQAAL